MNEVSPLKLGIIDLAAIFFIIGGVVSLVVSILTIPIATIYPFVIPTAFTMVFLVVFGITLVCSIGAIHCYTLAVKRMLSEAGMRGIIFGALLLIFSLGIVESYRLPNTTSVLMEVSASLILIAGAICFLMRHTAISGSTIAHPTAIAQPAYHA